MQTYWLQIREESRHSSNTLANGSVSGLSSLGGNDIDDSSSRGISDARKNLLAAIGTSEEDYAMKTERLIQWNVEILAGLLRQVMARRASRPNNFIVNRAKNQRLIIASGGKVLNEVVDILSLPQFNESIFKNHVDPNTIQLSSKVMNQLTDYVRKIAAGYR